MHRVLLYRRDGFTVWDSSWYGGQWTLDYSVVFAPVASTLGLHLLSLLAAATSALGFERIVSRHFGRSGRAACVVFAVGTVVETSIGQLPFLAGEAVGLCAVWAATRGRWPLAWLLAAVATLLSPLAGAYVGLVAAAWFLASGRGAPRRWRGAVAAVAVAATLPLIATTVLFPGEGHFPFDLVDCGWDLAIATGLWLICPRRQRVLRTGIVLYGLALIGSYLIPSPLGGNVGRLGDCLALPVATLLLWPRRRYLLLAVMAVPLVASAWGPAWGAMSSRHTQPSDEQAFYTPLDGWLARVDPGGTRGRVEVVPTDEHWESVWVADVEPLARGWERQTDVSANPIFYRPGALTASSYRAWLLDNGVAYVALPSAPLDYAGVEEGRLVAHGVPGLQPVWRDDHWRVWAVEGSTGLVTGPARVVALDDERVVLQVERPGSILVRVTWAGNWAVDGGDACASPAGRWTRVDASRSGTVRLAVELHPGSGRCGVTPPQAPTATSTPSARNAIRPRSRPASGRGSS